MPKLFMRDFEPHFNDDLYKVTNWNNWDRHTEAELYRGCAKKYSLELLASAMVFAVGTFAILFTLGDIIGITVTTVENLWFTMLFSAGIGLSHLAGANRIINLYLSNLDRVQETQDIQVEDD